MVGLDRECRLFLFCKEAVKALSIFSYFICCHLSVRHGWVVFTVTADGAAWVLIQVSVEDGWKLLWLTGKIRIASLEFLEIAV